MGKDRPVASGMSLGERVRHEAREIGLVTLYFLACFGIFLTLKKLLLEEYHVSIYVFHAAVIGALVVAKVVVVLEKTSFGDRFRTGSLIAHALWRSLAYTAVVFAVTFAEHLVEAWHAKGSFGPRSRSSGPARTSTASSPRTSASRCRSCSTTPSPSSTAASAPARSGACCSRRRSSLAAGHRSRAPRRGNDSSGVNP